MKDSNDAVPEHATEYLFECNATTELIATTLPALLKVTESKNYTHGQFPCQAIAAIDDKAQSAVPLVIEIMESDRPEQLLIEACEALSAFGREDVLVRSLDAGRAERRVAATLGTVHLTNPTPDPVSRLRNNGVES